jgi:predicted nucleotidyltransferase
MAWRFVGISSEKSCGEIGTTDKMAYLYCKKRKMLTQNQIDTIIEAMLPYNPVRIGIFGSVARNEETESSDIDILYSLKDTIAFSKFLDLQEGLEEKLNRKVDLVSERFLHPKLRPSVMEDLKPIYCNNK